MVRTRADARRVEDTLPASHAPASALQPEGIGARSIAALAEARRIVQARPGGGILAARRSEAASIIETASSGVGAQVRDRIAWEAGIGGRTPSSGDGGESRADYAPRGRIPG